MKIFILGQFFSRTKIPVTDPGDNALFCEGKYEAWYHRKCVGLLKCAYEQASESNDPFYCMFCLQTHYNNAIAGLKE